MKNNHCTENIDCEALWCVGWCSSRPDYKPKWTAWEYFWYQTEVGRFTFIIGFAIIGTFLVLKLAQWSVWFIKSLLLLLV